MNNKYVLYGRTIGAWCFALLLFFPIFWLGLMAFKTEGQAISTPPLLFFTPTLHSFAEVMARDNYFAYAMNSLITSILSTALGLAIAIPAAYSMAFFPTRGTIGLLKFMLSSRYMPGVGALMPIYICYQYFGLLDTRLGLTIMFMLMNLPIMIWLLYTNMKELPREILEAARMDGASVIDEFRHIVLPLSVGGIASTALVCMVWSWNESFWSLNLGASSAGTLAWLIASYSSPEGLFWAKLSAASLMAIAPIMALGWFCQKQLVQGMTFGAVK
ncbi:carbohydrate ABC transporter permease [Janthinobacterium agaricidamnosum]|uniref:Binding--dependent transport system inner membrane component family protein n=1 Tax=Janthinobacterium agaricidamnosum NBRC 102515 = DSM 9628 TaxID=1349767 RepID=W0V441_9BURK|nr:carbohydrate ABC transporter permease [Janthinobacterium agaricidamnosum]CDG82118.1 binding--dependent transport system inner membrane component family protein [Janthinobacterium agaricidamnosum NBRC 102515 = DSM 9628]